jgi:ADP-ribosylglycohydrolase
VKTILILEDHGGRVAAFRRAVAALGGYFADDLDRCVAEARASSLVAHTHPEGVAGTIAVAVAAAMAWQLRTAAVAERPRRFFDEVLRRTPASRVRRGILLASQTANLAARGRSMVAAICFGARHRPPSTLEFPNS